MIASVLAGHLEGVRPAGSASRDTDDGKCPRSSEEAFRELQGERTDAVRMSRLGHGLPSRMGWLHSRCAPDRCRHAATPQSAALGHNRTHDRGKRGLLFDYLVGAAE
jgi:hypothetical protein